MQGLTACLLPIPLFTCSPAFLGRPNRKCYSMILKLLSKLEVGWNTAYFSFSWQFFSLIYVPLYNSKEKTSHNFLIHLHSPVPCGFVRVIRCERSFSEPLKASTLSVNKSSELAESKWNLDPKNVGVGFKPGICVLWVGSKLGSFLALLWFSHSASLGLLFHLSFTLPRVVSSEVMMKFTLNAELSSCCSTGLGMLRTESQDWSLPAGGSSSRLWLRLFILIFYPEKQLWKFSRDIKPPTCPKSPP